jgi:hypothetical protein
MVQAPRVVIAPHALSTPRVITAVINKPIGVSTLTEKHETLQRHAKHLNDIVKQRQQYAQTQSKTRTHVTDLEHAMHIMEQHTSSEMANEIFDEESGKYLKYWQLLAHPNYKEVWSHSSANEFGPFAQGVGNCIKGADTIFFVSKQEIPFD